MRHNLGPESAPWAREVDATLAALESPRPTAANPTGLPGLQTRVLHRVVTLDFNRPGRTGLSPVMALAKPVWAHRVILTNLASTAGRDLPGSPLPSFRTFEVWVSSPTRPSWIQFYSSAGGGRGEFDLLGDPTLLLQMRDMEPMPSSYPDELSVMVSLMLTWMA